MKFRNYCLVVMGDTKNILDEIVKVAESEPNSLDAKGVFIATFTSNAEPSELSDYFKLNGRSFFIFDLDTENSGYFIGKQKIHEGLFGFLKNMDSEILEEKTRNLIEEISSSTKTNKTLVRNKKGDISVDDIDKLTPTEKNILINKLIDKGVENLSEEDKKILDKLAT